MFHKADQVAQLIVKYMEEALSREESRQLDNWLEADSANRALFEKLTRESSLQKELKTFYDFDQPDKSKKLAAYIYHTDPPPVHIGWKLVFQRLAIAASVLVCIGVGILLYQQFYKAVPAAPPAAIAIAPASHKATLTLSGGHSIELDTAGATILAREQGAIIRLDKATGQLVYTQNATATSLQYNTISVPRGGLYSLVLEDGTKVWLNNETVLRYPVSFSSLRERRVYLDGEAYFDVHQNNARPFIVEMPAASVQVLGTSFNAKAYAQEPTAVTLSQGAVRVAATRGQRNIRLQPGEQALLSPDSPLQLVTRPDMEMAMAWRNNLFHITEGASLKDFLVQVERWYDITVTYTGKLPPVSIQGDVYRDVNLDVLLQHLQKIIPNIRFKQRGRIVTVSASTY